MVTIELKVEMNKKDIPFLKKTLEYMRAKTISLKEEKDDTEMTKEEFYAMIDEASKSKKTRMTSKQFKERYLK